jgi:outer membrane receptor protein involved in Fe transport
MEAKFKKLSGRVRNLTRGSRNHVVELAILGLLILLSSVTMAQTGFSGLRGNVRDDSGAVIPAATVVLTEPSTGVQIRTAVSDDQGNFEFPNLKPGTYQVKSEMKGFRPFVAKDVQLDAGQIRRLDIKLSVGAAQDSVEVRAGAAVINTEGGTISNTVETKKNADIPLIETYPSPYSLFATMPMVQGRDWGINIAGQNEDQMSIQINGMSNDRAGDQNNNLRFVEEATVTTVNASADSSRVVSYNLTTKRGGNAWHGAVFYQHYNSALNATPHPQPKKDAYIQHDWQGEIGGPIWKDHTFFYASWFQNRAPLGSYHTATVPTAAMWGGNLSGVPGIGTITDPQTGQPFPNNVIPADRISSVAKALKAYYPLPNIGDPNAYSANNFGWHHPYTSPLNYMGNWPYLRLDHNISSKNTIYASWMQRLTPFIGAGNVPSIPWTRMRDNRQLTVADTHSFSPRLLNTARFGFSDDVINDGVALDGQEPPKGGDMIAALGIQGVNPAGLNTAGGPVFSTDDSIINFRPASKWKNKAKTFSVEDSLSYQAGRHLWKFGGEVSAFRSTDENASNYGTFNFSGLFTGSPFADFLLGLPSQSKRTDPLVNRTIIAKELGFYVMDTFKLTPRLTLDYGLRWDYYSLPTYTDGLMYNFDMTTQQVVVPQSMLSEVNPAYRAVPVVAGQAVPSADRGNFRPRFAASYLLGNGFVIRGGYGQFTERFGHDYASQAANQGAGPFERLSETFNNTNVSGQPLFSFPNPFPSSVNGVDVPSSWVVALPKHWNNGTIHQFNVSLEKEIANIGLRASYVGSRSRGLNYMQWKNENILSPSTTPYDQRIQNGEELPFPTLSEVYPYHHDGAANYNAFQVEAVRKQGWFTFDAHYTYAKNTNNIEQTDDVLNPTKVWGPQLDVHDQMFTVTTRWELPFGNGRRHLNNLPKVVDGFLGGWAVQTISTFGSGTHLTPYFYGFDIANNNYNSSIPDLIPGANPNLPSDQRTAQRWFNTPVYHQDARGTWIYDQLGAFKVPGCSDTDPMCLNSNPENVGRFGNAKHGSITGPGINVHHLSLAKSFPVTERVRTTFTMEISNLFNHPHYWDPSTWFQASDAGQMTWALPDNDPFKGGHRLISFKFRIEF